MIVNHCLDMSTRLVMYASTKGTHAPNFVKIGNGFPNSNKFFIPMIIY
jgi:hypothetical protein